MNGTTLEPVPQLPHAVTCGCIMCIGFLLNTIAIWILLRRHSLKSPNVIFMLNLALADLLLTCILPLKVYFYATGTWPLGQLSCVLEVALFKVHIRSSSFFITCINVDRLLAVVYPLKFRHIRTAPNAAKAAMFVWILVTILAVPKSIMFRKYLKDNNESFCFFHPAQNLDNIQPLRLHVGIIQLALFLVLLLVNIVSTGLVSLTLRNRKDQPKIKNKINVMLLFILSLIMFTVCFLPPTINLLFKGRRTYLLCLASVNCCLDPLLYYFSIDAFWKKKNKERNTLKPRDEGIRDAGDK